MHAVLIKMNTEGRRWSKLNTKVNKKQNNNNKKNTSYDIGGVSVAVSHDVMWQRDFLIITVRTMRYMTFQQNGVRFEFSIKTTPEDTHLNALYALRVFYVHA